MPRSSPARLEDRTATAYTVPQQARAKPLPVDPQQSVSQMLMSPGGRLAKLYYMANNFRVLVPGDHVLCARTGERIALDHLRYWNVARQEAYATAHLATQAGAG